MKKKLFFLILFWSIQIFADDTCLELCSSCIEDSGRESCVKVEKLCKCSAMLEGLKQELATPDTTPADSAAPAIQNSLEVATADTLVKADTVESTDSIQDANQNVAVVEELPPQQEDNKTLQDQNAEKKKPRNFYWGVSLGYEQFQEETVANFDVEKTDDPFDHMGVNFGFFLRWYFYSAGSFQLGLNAVYHHGRYDIEEYDFRVGYKRYNYSHDVWIDYHNIMAEIPLTFRFGIPFVLSPYVSLDVHVRKPLYAWIDYSADVSLQLGDYYSYTSRYYDFDDVGESDAAFTEEDWEFLGYLGFGLELTRHLSIQWQMLLINAVTYTNEILNYKLLTKSWRISLDIAF